MHAADETRPAPVLDAGGLLRSSTVLHLSPGEAAFEGMLRGWGLQQRSRNLVESTVISRDRVIRQFQRFTNSQPWTWAPVDLEEFVTTLRAERHVAYSTVRYYQNTIALFGEYVLDPRYGWSALCADRFGQAPLPICHEGNTVRHRSEFEGRPERRALTRKEVQSFLDHADNEVANQRRLGRKGWLSAWRDATVFKVAYTFRAAAP